MLSRRAFMAVAARAALAGFATLAGFVTLSAKAETPEIRFARQFSMGYLQFNVMEHEKLVEKHARALGLPDVKVSWVTFNGPNAMNEALISRSVDVVAGGVPGLLTIWARTRGTANEVRAISVSVQAVVLQMAAAKEFGPRDFARLDPLTVSMAPPDATVALIGGAAGVTCVFGVPPYQEQQLEHPGIRTILNSYDVLGGPHSFTVAWTTASFRDRNPVLYRALIAALEEATGIVNKDRRAAAALWIADVHSNLPLDKAAKVVSGPQVKWTLVPENTMQFARFMRQAGTIQ